MLDYAIIAKSKGNTWNQLDETIAFLQSCKCLSKYGLHSILYFFSFSNVRSSTLDSLNACTLAVASEGTSELGGCIAVDNSQAWATNVIAI